MLFEHERNDGLGMDAVVTVCSLNTTGCICGHGCYIEHAADVECATA